MGKFLIFTANQAAIQIVNLYPPFRLAKITVLNIAWILNVTRSIQGYQKLAEEISSKTDFETSHLRRFYFRDPLDQALYKFHNSINYRQLTALNGDDLHYAVINQDMKVLTPNVPRSAADAANMIIGDNATEESMPASANITIAKQRLQNFTD